MNLHMLLDDQLAYQFVIPKERFWKVTESILMFLRCLEEGSESWNKRCFYLEHPVLICFFLVTALHFCTI